MSVRVNLLPREVEERNAAARARTLVAIAGVAFLAALAAAYMWQVGQVNAAQTELEVAQAEVARLQGEVAALSEFELLQQRAEASSALLASSLGSEVSIAGILQDVASIMPTDAEFASLAVSVTEVPSTVAFNARSSFGQVSASGQVRDGHAPGVERFIIQFEKVASFFDVWIGSSSVDVETGIASFTVDLKLGPEIFTRRYAEGLPEELR